MSSLKDGTTVCYISSNYAGVIDQGRAIEYNILRSLDELQDPKGWRKDDGGFWRRGRSEVVCISNFASNVDEVRWDGRLLGGKCDLSVGIP